MMNSTQTVMNSTQIVMNSVLSPKSYYVCTKKKKCKRKKWTQDNPIQTLTKTQNIK